jgi:hypothetical protein
MQLLQAQPKVHELAVVNSDTDLDMREIPLTIDTLYMDQNLTIRAKVSGPVVSVRMYIDNVLKRNENKPPFGLSANENGDFAEWFKTPGLFKISAVPFTGSNGTGIKGDTLSRYVRVIWPNDTSNNIPFVLVDAIHDVDIRTLHDDDTIYLATGDKITLRAIPVYGKSVAFTMNGVYMTTQNSVPFSIKGDEDGDYTHWPAKPGYYTLVAKVFSDYVGKGVVLEVDTIRFLITDNFTLSVSGFPNPLQDNVSVNVATNVEQEVQITLMDNIGKTYYSQNLWTAEGENSFPINVSDFQLTTGIYFIRIRGDKDEKVIKFYKQ